MSSEPPPGGPPDASGAPYPPYSPYPPYPNAGGYQQPYYQQPYPGPMPPPPTVSGDGGAVIAGLGYLIFLVGLIMFFVEQRNRLVKFHAAQSLIIHLGAVVASLAWVVIFVVLAVLGAALGIANSSSAGAAAASLGVLLVVAVLIGIVLCILYVAALIWGMVAAFSGQMTKIPVVGDLAERWASATMPQP